MKQDLEAAKALAKANKIPLESAISLLLLQEIRDMNGQLSDLLGYLEDIDRKSYQ